MKIARHLAPLLLLFLVRPAAAAGPGLSNSVQFTPVLRLYVCPPVFTYRSDCAVREKVLEPQKLDLNVQVLTERMGQWTVQSADPIIANYYVIVVRGPVSGHMEYSVSAETGLPGSAAPFANSRVEFPDNAIPESFGVSSATMEKEGKKYLTEIRITGFQALPAMKAKH